MPKPPSFDPKRIDEIFRARDAKERVQAFLKVAPGGVAPFELVVELAAAAGARAFRDTYEGGAPMGYTGFSGALELLPFLPEPERGLALLQGVSGIAAEGVHAEPNFAGFPWSHSLSHEATLDDLDQSIAERALPKFHGRLVPFVNEETRRKYGHRYLFARSVLDFANAGQRHIVVGRGLRLADAVRWRKSEQSLYALSHYFLHAPQEYEEAEALQAWLEGLGKDLPGDNRNRKAALPADEALAIERALAGEGGKTLFESLLGVWNKGYSLEAIAEGLLLVAEASLQEGGNAPAAARAVLFVDASLASFPWLRGHDGLVQVLMCAQFLRRLGVAARPAGAGADATAAGAGTEALVAALEQGRAAEAAGLSRALASAAPDPAIDALAGAAAARDGGGADGGLLALAPILLGQFRRSTSVRKDEHLAALAAWLSRPAGRSLALEWRRTR